MSDDGLDTALARRLLAAGALPQAVLQDALGAARAQRGGAELSLALVLVSRRLLPAELVAEHLRAVSALLPPVPGAESWRSHYEPLRELGRGGMGVVWEVRHRGTGQRYALKQLALEGVADPVERARFAREARLLASLDHPGLVRVHAAGLEDPDPWFVQELLPGGSLQDRLRGGPLPEPDLRRILAEVGAALSYLHRRGVLHRDLKPANVLFGDQGQARLTDFGLARAAGHGLTLTQTGELLGTPAYMAPEQISDPRRVDERSDVYALGALLYALLTGAPPFLGATVWGTLDAVLREPPRPPSELAPGVAPELEAACLAALAKEPAARPGRVEELLARCAPGASRRGPRWPLRLGLGLAGLAGAAGLAWGLGRSAGPSPPPSAAPRPPASSPPPVLEPAGSSGSPARPEPAPDELPARLRVPASPQAWLAPPAEPSPFTAYLDDLRRIDPQLEWIERDAELLEQLLGSRHKGEQAATKDARTGIFREQLAAFWLRREVAPQETARVLLASGRVELAEATLFVRLLRRDAEFFRLYYQTLAPRSEELAASQEVANCAAAALLVEPNPEWEARLRSLRDRFVPDSDPWRWLRAQNEGVWRARVRRDAEGRLPGSWGPRCTAWRVLALLNRARAESPEWAAHCAALELRWGQWPNTPDDLPTDPAEREALERELQDLRGRPDAVSQARAVPLELGAGLLGRRSLQSAAQSQAQTLDARSPTLGQAQAWTVLIALVGYDTPLPHEEPRERWAGLGRVLEWAGRRRAALAACTLAKVELRMPLHSSETESRPTPSEALDELETLLRVAREVELGRLPLSVLAPPR